jgi:hypothetical protein
MSVHSLQSIDPVSAEHSEPDQSSYLPHLLVRVHVEMMLNSNPCSGTTGGNSGEYANLKDEVIAKPIHMIPAFENAV